MNHTPGPWTISERRIGSEYVITAPGAIIGRICSEPNARFVVRACNAHDELLEALREIDDMCVGKLPLTAQVKEIARAAIKATGG